MLEYLFQFLDACDFSSEGSKKIREKNKTLISASVLGLIFEKINGHNDGLICHETIKREILQKFKEKKG